MTATPPDGTIVQTDWIRHAEPGRDFTETQIRVWRSTRPGHAGVTVNTRLAPGGSWWSRPNPRTMRRWVINTLAAEGYELVPGTRRDETRSTPSGWTHRYEARHIGASRVMPAWVGEPA